MLLHENTIVADTCNIDDRHLNGAGLDLLNLPQQILVLFLMNINFLSVEVGVHLGEVVDKILVHVITELLDFIYVFENALLFPLVGIVSLLKRFQLVVDRLQFLAEILTIHLELFLVVFGNVLSVQLRHRILVLLGNKFSSKLSSIGLDEIFN